jgi:alkaline phosphatase D
MLGTTQRNWLLSSLQGSKARWRIIGNQVIFSEFHVGWAAQAIGQTPAQAESQFLDIWDGYPFERALIMNTLQQNRINNCVFLTGDFHCSFAFDVADSVTNPNSSPFPYAPTTAYNPATGKGSVAVEFATPSITSANFDENVGAALALSFQNQINRNLPVPFPSGYNPNPHMKYVDLIRHGYFVLDVREDSVSADYFYVDSILSIDRGEKFGQRPYSLSGSQRLLLSNRPTAAKSKQDVPAPRKTKASTTSTEKASIWQGKVYPNPARTHLHFESQATAGKAVDVQLFDYNGQLLAEKKIRPQQQTQMLDVSSYPKGLYFVRFSANGEELLHKIVLQ